MRNLKKGCFFVARLKTFTLLPFFIPVVVWKKIEILNKKTQHKAGFLIFAHQVYFSSLSRSKIFKRSRKILDTNCKFKSFLLRILYIATSEARAITRMSNALIDDCVNMSTYIYKTLQKGFVNRNHLTKIYISHHIHMILVGRRSLNLSTC